MSDSEKECPRCDGHGRVSLGDGWTVCPKCKGKKTISEDMRVDQLVAQLLDEQSLDSSGAPDAGAAGEKTMLAAVELLKDLNASYEYPGWISVDWGGLSFAFGDMNNCWGGNYGPPSDPGEVAVEEELPLGATPEELADYVRRSVKKALDYTKLSPAQ